MITSVGILRNFLLFMAVCVVPQTAYGEVYLSKEQALNSVFGMACEQSYDPKPITSATKKELLSLGLWGVEQESAHFFLCKKDGVVVGYALIDSEVGKHLPITFIVGITPSGTVSKVELMVFREIRGWEVREGRFMDQFQGKREDDSLVVGKGISNVTGATLSAQAMVKGVRRALFLWKYFYHQGV